MNYQNYVENLFKHACYAACLSYKFRNMKELDWVQITQDILDGIKIGALDKGCYVAYPVKYINNVLGGNIKDVTKPQYKLENLTEDINIVMYSLEDNTHFVCVDKHGDIVFDPSYPSNTCKYGIPTSIRRFIYA